MIDKRCCKQVEKQIAEQTDKLKAKKQSVINGLGEGYAKKAADFINEKVYDETYQKLKKVLQLKAKAKNLAASAVKQAVLLLKAMLGQQQHFGNNALAITSLISHTMSLRIGDELYNIDNELYEYVVLLEMF